MSTAGRFSPDGARFAIARDTFVEIYDSRTQNFLGRLDGHLLAVNDLSWSPCSRYVASGADDFLVIVWSVSTFKPVRTLRGHTQSIASVRFNYKGNLIVSTSIDENLRVWDVRQARCLTILAAHSEPVCAADFCFDSTLIVSGSYDGLVRLWDTQSGHCLKTLTGAQNNPLPVTFTRFTPNGQYVIVSNIEGQIQIWDYVNTKIVMVFEAPPDKFTRSIGIHDRSLVIATATGMRVYDISSGELKSELTFAGGALTADISPDGTKILFAGPRGFEIRPLNLD